MYMTWIQFRAKLHVSHLELSNQVFSYEIKLTMLIQGCRVPVEVLNNPYLVNL